MRSSTVAPTSNAAGGSVGTPLANAIGYGCWHVARRLVACGARVDTLWQAAVLRLQPRVEELLSADPASQVGMFCGVACCVLG